MSWGKETEVTNYSGSKSSIINKEGNTNDGCLSETKNTFNLE